MKKQIKQKVKEVSESKLVLQLKENIRRNSYIVMMMILIIAILMAIVVGLLW